MLLGKIVIGFCLLLSGCASTRLIPPYQIQQALQEDRSSGGIYLVHHGDKEWVLDSTDVSGDQISGNLHHISRRYYDTVWFDSKVLEPGAYGVKVLYLRNVSKLNLDSLPHRITFPIQNIELAEAYRFDKGKTGLLIGCVSGIILIPVIIILGIAAGGGV